MKTQASSFVVNVILGISVTIGVLTLLAAWNRCVDYVFVALPYILLPASLVLGRFSHRLLWLSIVLLALSVLSVVTFVCLMMRPA